VNTLQDTVRSGVVKARDVLLEGLEATQERLKNQQKRSAKNLQKARKDLKNIQGTVQAGVSRTQDAFQSGLGVAQGALEQNMKAVNKNLKKARKNLKNLQENLQDTMQSGVSQAQDVLLSGLSATQDVLGKNTKYTAKGLKEARKNLTDTGNSLQTQLERRARRRKRAKTVFRMGLLAGFLLMLLYAPWPGSETRRQLVELWQGLFARQE
jgi:Skp family chaperone for outer membrane proteins